MKKQSIHWLYFMIILSIHLHKVVKLLITEIPMLVPVFASTAIVFILSRKLVSPFFIIGKTMVVFFIMTHCFILSTYFFVKPSALYFIPFFTFIMIEVMRQLYMKKISFLHAEIEEMNEQQHQFNEAFQAVRKERHDYLKHVSALHFMLENRESDDAKLYLNNLVECYYETNASIKGERGGVAGILHQAYYNAKEMNIQVTYNFDIPLSTLPISDVDMSKLMGNLLSNSVEACEEYQEKTKKQANLSLQFYKRSGLYMLICKNHTVSIPANVLDSIYKKSGKTTKNEGHEGLGTSIIQNIVEKHKGFLDFVHKDDEFLVKIKIPAIH